MYINKALLIYPGFIIAFLMMAAVFVTSTTYIQLGVAIVLYPVLAFFAYKVFLDRKQINPTITTKTNLQDIPTQTNTLGIADIDKRTFLKLIGATGISFFLISIFGRRIESLVFGNQNLGQAPATTGNPPADKTSAAVSSPTESYNISEVDDGIIAYYGFIDKQGQWFIMKGDNNTGSYRYVRGKSNFPSNWKKRQNLDYDYFNQVFP